VLLYIDEKVPLQQRHTGVQRGHKYRQRLRMLKKIKEILNMFEGSYNHTNDKMHIHCYQKKTAKQFVDFIKRIDRRYDKNLQNIFLVLDNLSAHKSKLAKKEEISKRCPRINFVLLPYIIQN
jgi:hypothetical protein